VGVSLHDPDADVEARHIRCRPSHKGDSQTWEETLNREKRVVRMIPESSRFVRVKKGMCFCLSSMTVCNRSGNK
jgi:hypothetical protein